MIWRIFGAIGLTGVSLVLVASLWVATHLRDLPEVDDADLRTIPAVAPEADAGPALYRAAALLQLDESDKKQLIEWRKGTSWHQAGVSTLLARNAAALAALTEADEKPDLAFPADRRMQPSAPLRGSVPAMVQELEKHWDDDPVRQDAQAWRDLAWLRLLRALRLHRDGKTQAAVAEIVATARLGYLIEGAAGGGLFHYMNASAIKSVALKELVDVAGKSQLSPHALRALGAEVAKRGANTRGFANAWAGEYRWELTLLEALRASPQEPAEERQGPRRALKCLLHARFIEALIALVPEDYLYQPHRTEALWADLYRSLQRDAGRTYVERSRSDVDVDLNAFKLRILRGPNPTGLLVFGIGAKAFNRFVARKCAENVQAAATSTILALLAYQREHGSLPDRLEELVPGELSQVPIDDFDGAPLRYSRERRRLWSVGTDLRDEGGSDDGATPDTKQPTFSIPG